MAKYVYEIMNAEVMSIGPREPVKNLQRQILALGITGVPVIAEDGAPLGMVSLRDLAAHPEAEYAEEIMSAPVIAVDQRWEIEAAGRLLCEVGLHRLVCVNDHGAMVGVVSSVDLLRGCLGLPAKHPSAFPHFDRETGALWTDDIPLELDAILSCAPEGPGVLVLIYGGKGVPETIVWAESVGSVSSRLLDIVSGPQPRAMERLLERGSLRFRAARIENDEQRRQTLRSVANLGRAAHRVG
jgi:CBS domain-containing protein